MYQKARSRDEATGGGSLLQAGRDGGGTADRLALRRCRAAELLFPMSDRPRDPAPAPASDGSPPTRGWSVATSVQAGDASLR